MIPPAAFKAMNRKGDDRLTLTECSNPLFPDFAVVDVNVHGWHMNRRTGPRTSASICVAPGGVLS